MLIDEMIDGANRPMNNAELIAALRVCGHASGCPEFCPRYRTYENGLTCAQYVIFDAADALEAAEAYEKAWSNKCERLEKRIAELEAQMPKEGEWKKILQNDDGTSGYQCSACLGIIENVPDDDEHPLCSFCPNCGAKMSDHIADVCKMVKKEQFGKSEQLNL